MSVIAWLANRGLQQSNERLRALHKAQVQKTVKQQDRVAELEAELARVSLLTFALADVCLAKGLLTQAELKERLGQLDLSDGATDGRLAPGHALPGSEGAPGA